MIPLFPNHAFGGQRYKVPLPPLNHSLQGVQSLASSTEQSKRKCKPVNAEILKTELKEHPSEPECWRH